MQLRSTTIIKDNTFTDVPRLRHRKKFATMKAYLHHRHFLEFVSNTQCKVRM